MKLATPTKSRKTPTPKLKIASPQKVKEVATKVIKNRIGLLKSLATK